MYERGRERERERKRAKERRIEVSKLRSLRVVVYGISLAVSLTDVWVKSETHSHLMVSSCRLIGWAAEELLGSHFNHVAPCDSTKDSRSMFQK